MLFSGLASAYLRRAEDWTWPYGSNVTEDASTFRTSMPKLSEMRTLQANAAGTAKLILWH